MTTYFLDASALAKRYLTETGSQWILTITNPTAGHTIIVAEITRVEVASALAARHRASLGFTQQQRDRAVKLLLHHCFAQYRTASLNPTTISRAVNLTQNYRLRGYDAVQLATAIITNEALVVAGLPGLTFAAADTDLLAAAQAENLAIDNPNLYP